MSDQKKRKTSNEEKAVSAVVPLMTELFEFGKEKELSNFLLMKTITDELESQMSASSQVPELLTMMSIRLDKMRTKTDNKKLKRHITKTIALITRAASSSSVLSGTISTLIKTTDKLVKTLNLIHKQEKAMTVK